MLTPRCANRSLTQQRGWRTPAAIGFAWTPCMPDYAHPLTLRSLTFLRTTNSFSAPVRRLISSSYLSG